MKRSRIFILGVLVLLLNVVWEFSHFRLYVDLTGIPKTQHLLIASFTDLILISLIFAINSLNQKVFMLRFKTFGCSKCSTHLECVVCQTLRHHKSMRWIEKPKFADYFFIVILGALISSVIEIYSVGIGRWAYTELMPTIFGIGVSPLIQLFVTGILGLLIFNYLNKKFVSFY